MTKDITAEHVLNDLRYLTLLARSFPTVADASTEIINLAVSYTHLTLPTTSRV